ncbi:MAG: hypothetical protein JW812_01345 [Alphaproteobacteria bacterium]|nr:hypothetical protein [Alphaproteobacteria bacterium]MBN2779770.1 hypothetical protein [Alphaproteobacteria bacterium]
MRKILLFFVAFFISAGANADVFSAVFSEALGSSVTSSIYASYASCWTCGYILEILDLFSSISLSLFEDLRLPIITLLAITLVGWITYKMITGFLNLSPPDANSLFKDLAPKFFAMIIFLPLLFAPTPKFIYNYMVEPLIDLGSSYGTKVMEIVSGEDIKPYCLMQYAESDATQTQDDTFSPSFRQNLVCMTSQSHQINAIGITLGTVLIQESFKAENRYFYIIPNLGMGFAGGILAITYFVALIVFPLYLIGSLFELGFVLAFLPFALFSFIITRGGKGTGVFEGIFDTSVQLVIKAALMMLFLPFMLSVSHIIFQTALDTELFGYASLVGFIQQGDTNQIVETFSFGTKGMLFLSFVAILNIYLITSTKTIVGWFGAEYDDRLFNWSYKNFTDGLKWANKKRKDLFGKKPPAGNSGGGSP